MMRLWKLFCLQNMSLTTYLHVNFFWTISSSNFQDLIAFWPCYLQLKNCRSKTDFFAAKRKCKNVLRNSILHSGLKKKVFKIFLFAECLSRIVGQKRTEKEKKKLLQTFQTDFRVEKFDWSTPKNEKFD
jgi:hypothetical protein